MVKTLTLVGPKHVEIREEPSRNLEPGEARLRSLVSGISHGTELNTYRGTSPFDGQRFDHDYRLFRSRTDGASYPTGLGYEMVSEVVEVAPDVTAVQPGDVVHTASSHRDEVVVNVEWASSAALPLTKLPRTDRPERAVFLSLAGVALQAVHDAYVKLGDAVVVSGLGTIGLLTVQLVRANGAGPVIAVDPHATRRELAVRYGADAVIDPDAVEESVGLSVREAIAWATERKKPGQPTSDDNEATAKLKLGGTRHLANGGRGADTVIETSGSYRGLHAAIASVGVAGRVVSVGFFRGDVGADLRLGEEWHHNRPTLVSSMGVWGCPHRDHPLWDRHRVATTAAELLLGDRLRTDGLLTRTVPFDTAPRVYADLDADPRSALKIAFSYT